MLFFSLPFAIAAEINARGCGIYFTLYDSSGTLPYDAKQIISEGCYLELNFIICRRDLREEVKGHLLNNIRYCFTRLKRALQGVPCWPSA